MLRAPFLLATFGLAVNALFWSMPLTVTAAKLPQLTDNSSLSPADILRALPHEASTSSLREALLRLIGAESEALAVAAAALQQPLPADIGQQANHAGQDVHSAAADYIRAAQAVVDFSSRR